MVNVKKSHGSGMEHLGLPRYLGIAFVPMLYTGEALLTAHHCVVIAISSLSSPTTSQILGNPQTFDSWRCSCTAFIYPITQFSPLVASPGEKKDLLRTDIRLTVLVHVTRACVFVAMAATFCSHSTACVYVDVIHYLQTLESIPSAAVYIWAASL